MRMKPTLAAIANKAGVSLSTASLVLANKGKISPAVQEKVRAAAREIGYDRHRGRKSGETKTCAVLFHFDHNLAHTWNRLRRTTLALQEHLDKQGFLTVIIPISYEMSDNEIFRRVRQSGAEAVFSLHFGRKDLFARFQNDGIQVVVVINSHFQSEFHTVCADNFQGSYEAARHLINYGHSNIIYAEFEIYQLPSTISDRRLGFYKAMQESGLEHPRENTLHLEIWNFDDIRKKFAAVFKKKRKPTAIFFVDDYLAVHCTGILAELGYAFPRDLSIIATGEVLDFEEPFIPKITTMSTDAELLGKYSAEMLFSILESSQESNRVLKIKQQLEDRGSCRPLVRSQ